MLQPKYVIIVPIKLGIKLTVRTGSLRFCVGRNSSWYRSSSASISTNSTSHSHAIFLGHVLANRRLHRDVQILHYRICAREEYGCWIIILFWAVSGVFRSSTRACKAKVNGFCKTESMNLQSFVCPTFLLSETFYLFFLSFASSSSSYLSFGDLRFLFHINSKVY